MNSNQKAFFALLKAGLWEQGVRLLPYEPFDFDALYKLAEDQSVVGLLAAGLEHVEDMKITKPQALPFMKKVFSLEVRNMEMNRFIEVLWNRLGYEGIHAVLIKGQGIAQCYVRPQWRSAGDIDLLLNKENYLLSKAFLSTIASFIDKEDDSRLHLGMSIDTWTVELHGSLRIPLIKRASACIDAVQEDTFANGHIRFWQNGNSSIPLPAIDNDIIFVFTHILQHFFGGGIGLRQICDWIRLLWTYRDQVNRDLLHSRIDEMRFVSEWEVFGSVAVDYLGMPQYAMPFYRQNHILKRRARRLVRFIIRTGNFGHNRDMSYLYEKQYLVRKVISFWNGTVLALYRAFIFPKDALSFYLQYLFSSSGKMAKGE